MRVGEEWRWARSPKARMPIFVLKPSSQCIPNKSFESFKGRGFLKIRVRGLGCRFLAPGVRFLR